MDNGNSKRGLRTLPSAATSHVKSGGKIKNPRPAGKKGSKNG